MYFICENLGTSAAQSFLLNPKRGGGPRDSFYACPAAVYRRPSFGSDYRSPEGGLLTDEGGL